MIEPNTFTDALSERMTCAAYDVYDAVHELGQDVPANTLAGAGVIAEMTNTLDALPNDVLTGAQRWLTALGVDDFEIHLGMAFQQIMADAFHPSNATEFLQGLNAALTQKFGPQVECHADDLADAIMLEFCNRPLMIDRTELSAAAQPQSR